MQIYIRDITIVYDYLERFGEKKLNLEIKSCFKEN